MDLYRSFSLAWDMWALPKRGTYALQKRQLQRLQQLVQYARFHSPYYKKLYNNMPEIVTSVKQLPYTTKPQLMHNYDEWVTDRRVRFADVQAFTADKTKIGQKFLDTYAVWTTSGSTGVPAIILHDDRELFTHDVLSYVRCFMQWLTPVDLWQFIRRGRRTASLFAVGGHLTGPVMARRFASDTQRGSGRVKVISVLLPIEDIVEQLNTYQPTILNGFSAMLGLLAQEQLAGRLRIKPHLIMASAEHLYPEMRAVIEEAFQVPVRDMYGLTETATVAVDCRYGRKHICSDWYIVEPVDKQYNPVPPGTPSDLTLITNLANYTQPLIRYEVGDCIMVYPDPCPCGSALPSLYVEGRTNEMLSFITSGGKERKVIPMTFVDVIGCAPGVYRYQVIQKNANVLSVRLQPKPGFAEKQVWQVVQTRLSAYFAEQGLADIIFEKAAEYPMRNQRTGKFHHVWSEVH